MIFFKPCKAVDIPRTGKKNMISNKNNSLNDFWADVSNIELGLSGAMGCYIFSVRAGGGAKPWYVGRTTDQTFRKECFSDHKVRIYNEFLNEREKGTPTLTLICIKTETGKFSKSKSNGEYIDFLEKVLIRKCFSRNPDLLNIKNTGYQKNIRVPGLLNSKKSDSKIEAVRDFKSLIGVK